MVIPRKRPFVQAIRDFPPGCGINLAERKPVEIVKKVNSNFVECNKFNSLKAKEFGGNKPSAGKVKFLDPACVKTGFDRKPKVITAHGPPTKILTRLDNVDTNEFGGNKTSAVSKPSGNTEFDQKLKVITTHEPPTMILKGLNSVDTNKFEGNKPSAVLKPSGNTEFDHKPKVITAHEPPTKILKRLNSVDTNKFGGYKPSAVSKPSGNTDFDQKPKFITTHEPQAKILKRFNNVDTKKFGENKPSDVLNKSYGPEKNVLNKSYLSAKTASKVKFYDPTSEVQKSEDKTIIVSRNELTKREKIQQAMEVFDQEYEPFCQENKRKPNNERIQSARIPMEVAKVVRQKLKWVDPVKIVGHVCGVQIGDKFKYRSQLMMIGLHSQPQSGIDFAKINGENVAISIVDAHRYSNETGSSDSLVYSGQGGISMFGGSKLPPEDQKLVRGNLAMKNSMDKKTEVRVIKKVQGFGRDVFVYDGLYIVVRYTEDESAEGKIVFKFHLNRVPGQPSLHNMLKW